MKIVLLQNIKGLGEKGEIKNVANGHARNFLIPQKLAVIATPKKVQQLEIEKIKHEHEAEAGLFETEKLVEKLQGQVIEMKGKVNDGGTLYAAVTATKVANKLKEMGFEVKKDQIVLPEPIKEIGEHSMVINFEHGLETEITVVVTE